MNNNKATVFIAGALLMLYLPANATNGDILEGIGAISEALGGTGVAAPQDPITALVNNPAALGATTQSGRPQFDLGLTLFKPVVDARIKTPAGEMSGGSKDPFSYIPYLGYNHPVNEVWNIGLGAYGISGMGVNYRTRGWDLDGNPANGYEGDVYTKVASMKSVAATSYRLTDGLVLGLALHGNYSTLDMNQGERDAFGWGAQAGLYYNISDWHFGASYTTPQRAKFSRLYNFDAFMGDDRKDTLVLEQPAIYALGVGWTPDKWLFEFNIKNLAWGSTDGYGDFDWEDQWVYAIGAQRQLFERLYLRVGFNYAQNPIDTHNGWNPMGIKTVQGKQVPTMGYELLRNVGFPGIVESHATMGFGYHFSDNLSLNVAYMHAFRKSISSHSAGDAFEYKARLAEDSLTLGLSWTFN